jgi:hypothetical protein
VFPVRYGQTYRDRTMDSVQNCDSYINISSSQTYLSLDTSAVGMSHANEKRIGFLSTFPSYAMTVDRYS